MSLSAIVSEKDFLGHVTNGKSYEYVFLGCEYHSRTFLGLGNTLVRYFHSACGIFEKTLGYRLELSTLMTHNTEKVEETQI